MVNFFLTISSEGAAMQYGAAPMLELEQKIRERAFHLWLADGGHSGNSEAYWLAAQREILASSLPEVAPAPKKVARKAKPVAAAKRKSKAA